MTGRRRRSRARRPRRSRLPCPMRSCRCPPLRCPRRLSLSPGLREPNRSSSQRRSSRPAPRRCRCWWSSGRRPRCRWAPTRRGSVDVADPVGSETGVEVGAVVALPVVVGDEVPDGVVLALGSVVAGGVVEPVPPVVCGRGGRSSGGSRSWAGRLGRGRATRARRSGRGRSLRVTERRGAHRSGRREGGGRRVVERRGRSWGRARGHGGQQSLARRGRCHGTVSERPVAVAGAGRHGGDRRRREDLRHDAGRAQTADADGLADGRQTGGGCHHRRACRHRAGAGARDPARRGGGDRAEASSDAAHRGGAADG